MDRPAVPSDARGSYDSNGMNAAMNAQNAGRPSCHNAGIAFVAFETGIPQICTREARHELA